MPDNFTIELDKGDLSRLFRRLGRVLAMDTLRAPMTRSVERLRRDLADYPPPARKRQPAKSRKQQIKQIMLAKEGKIPYRRTGNLGRSWTTKVDEQGDGIEGTVGNAVRSPEGTRYGPLVQGESTQASYHQDSWGTDQEALNKNRDAIIDDFRDAIDKALG